MSVPAEEAINHRDQRTAASANGRRLPTHPAIIVEDL